MLELKNINKSFGSLQVLDNVSATFGRGEVVSIVGPSGAGKTTLLQIAGTLDKPDSGSVVYDGVDVSAMPERKLSEFRNKRIGFVFQFHQLLPEFTALENVAIPALIHGESRSKAQARAKDLLEMLGLASRADHKPMELSGGEKQPRLAQQGGAPPTFLRLARPFQPNVCHSDPRRGTCRNVRPHIEDARRTDY